MSIISNFRQRLNLIRISRRFKVIFHSKVKINKSTVFEGHNAIHQNTEIRGSYIGMGTYIANNSILRKVKVGRFCAIGDNLKTGLGLHPLKKYVSIHPAFFSTKEQAGFTFVNNQSFEEHKYVDELKKYYVSIGNDVWIGSNVQIMDGVEIGDGAVIAAGAVVTKNVGPFEIVGGVPSKHIKFRFTEEQRQNIVKDPWWNKDFDWIKNNAIDFIDIDEFLKKHADSE